MSRFGSVITAMITIFTDKGAVDYDATADLAVWLVQQGNDALVVTGTTGESPVLTDEEQIAVWKCVREAVSVPLIAGSGTNDTTHACSLTSQAKDAGMDAVLIVSPYYNRPPQSGIEAHFRRVAASTELPVMLYDVPARTGRKISPDVILRLVSEVPNIWALKDAAGDPTVAAHIIAQAPDGFELYSGDDSLTLPLLSVGAVGVIGVATHWAANPMKQMIDAFFAGDVRKAQVINAALIESYNFETSEQAPNPIPTKAMLRAIGLPAGHCRLPLGEGPDELEEEATKIYAKLMAFRVTLEGKSHT